MSDCVNVSHYQKYNVNTAAKRIQLNFNFANTLVQMCNQLPPFIEIKICYECSDATF